MTNFLWMQLYIFPNIILAICEGPSMRAGGLSEEAELGHSCSGNALGKSLIFQPQRASSDVWKKNKRGSWILCPSYTLAFRCHQEGGDVHISCKKMLILTQLWENTHFPFRCNPKEWADQAQVIWTCASPILPSKSHFLQNRAWALIHN